MDIVTTLFGSDVKIFRYNFHLLLLILLLLQLLFLPLLQLPPLLLPLIFS